MLSVLLFIYCPGEIFALNNPTDVSKKHSNEAILYFL